MNYLAVINAKTGPCGVTMHYKDEDMKRERKDTKDIKYWLLTPPRNQALDLYSLIDSNLKQQLSGIDLIGKTHNGTITLENKIRYNNYKDMLIETYSKTKQLTPGWITYCKADYLVYVIKQRNKPIIGSIIKMPILKKWWSEQNPNEYELKIASNKKYDTSNRVVPYHKIPLNAYVYSDFLEFHNHFSISNFMK